MQNLEERIVHCARTTGARLVLLQGVQGSGKSTFAKQVSKRNAKCVIVSADDFMVDQYGTYRFEPTKLTECHQKCQTRAADSLKKGSYVIVDNCNARNEHVQPYIDMLNSTERFIVVYMKAESEEQALAFGRRSVHKVPDFAVLNTQRSIERISNPRACYITMPK